VCVLNRHTNSYDYYYLCIHFCFRSMYVRSLLSSVINVQFVRLVTLSGLDFGVWRRKNFCLQFSIPIMVEVWSLISSCFFFVVLLFSPQKKKWENIIVNDKLENNVFYVSHTHTYTTKSLL
jgi:hypothetical protein